jgi:hypothetical protein
MATILEAVGDYLVTGGHGTLGTTLFLGVMPESPDVLVAVYETSGSSPQFTMGSAATAIDAPSLQVICRGSVGDYPTARDKAVTLRTYLGSLANVTISGINIMRVAPEGSVLPMGEDENRRPMVSINFSCMVRP